MRVKPSKICAPRRRGFTLIEALVSLGLVALVIALAVPALAASRRHARTTLCITRCRDTGVQAVLSAGDAKGCFPMARISDQAANAAGPGSVEWARYTVQPWALAEALAHAQGSAADAPGWFCPFNQVRPTDPSANWDYIASATMYLAPAYLDPALPAAEWSGRLGAAAQRLDRVAFPDAKVVVHELYVWHAFDDPFIPGRDVSGLEYQNTKGRASVFYADGHAGPLARAEASVGVDRHPVWPGFAWDMTPRGVLGRDRAGAEGPALR